LSVSVINCVIVVLNNCSADYNWFDANVAADNRFVWLLLTRELPIRL